MFYSLALIFWYVIIGWACQFYGDESQLAAIDYRSIISDNIAARSLGRRDATSNRIELQNVRVFDGCKLRALGTVIIDNGLISHPCTACEACPIPDEVYDAQGMTLLPGLIDSHAHPVNVTHLTNLTRFGVTTAVNAFCPAPPLCASLQNHTGLTSLVTASFIATSPDSAHAKIVGTQGAPSLIHNVTQIPAWVKQQVAEGAEFIKVIGSTPLPGLSQEEQTTLVNASHKAGKQVVLHTSSYLAYLQGLLAGVDQIHHSTLDTPVDERLIEMFKKEKTIVCPTLTMMRAIVEQLHPANSTYQSASETVTKLHKAGVPVLAGTDANMQSSTPGKVAYGSSLHDELENLVAAGLSPIEALNAATVTPARYFDLNDRGAVKDGMRADLLLIDGDPTVNISATRNIVKVWVGGLPFDG